MNDTHVLDVNKCRWISNQRLDEKWKGEDKFWGMTDPTVNESGITDLMSLVANKRKYDSLLFSPFCNWYCTFFFSVSITN